MANDNKNINELVADEEDVTAELQELTLQQVLTRSADDDGDSDDDAATFDLDRLQRQRSNDDVEVLRSHLEARSDTINRLQFDVEQIRARWQGLQAEIKAREELTRELQAQVDKLDNSLATKARRLRERGKSIRSLKAEIRERQSNAEREAEARRELETTCEQLRQRIAELETAGRDAAQGRDALEIELRDNRAKIADLESASPELTMPPEDATAHALKSERDEARRGLQRMETYADDLRRQLGDQSATIESLQQTATHLTAERDDLIARNQRLSERLDTAATDNAGLGEQIARMQLRYNEDVASLNKQLEDEAQQALKLSNMIAEAEEDRAESIRYRQELERMFTQASAEHETTVAGLSKRIEQLETRRAADEKNLASKNTAIECLLAELAEQRGADQKRDSEPGDAEPPDAVQLPVMVPSGERERVNRLLVGRIDNQELRFPLFKKRLTIGRTQNNDIQLNVPYISRRHAVLLTEGDVTRVIDWGSKNGVYVNGRRVTECFLNSGDNVAIGNAEFRYEERPRRDA